MLPPYLRPAALLLYLTLPAAVVAAPALSVCVNFSCASQQSAKLSETEWQQIQTLFDTVSNAAEERDAVAKAIALLEIQVGRQTATWQDLAENWQRAGEPGELDCIAESNNTDRYLGVLEQAGLLRWHRKLPRVRRGLFFVHWTAVIEDRADHGQWAVDSWFRDNGQAAVILPLQDWYDGKEPRS